MPSGTPRAVDSVRAEGTGRAERLTRDARRRTILDAAADLLVTEGPQAISMEGVAARLGVSKPVIYDHFANGGELLAAIYDDYASFLTEAVTAALARSGDSVPELVRASIDGYFEAVAAKGFVIRLVGGAANTEPSVRSAQHRVRDQWTNYWTARLRGQAPIPPDTARHAVMLVSQMSEQAASLWLSGAASREAMADLYTFLTVAAIEALIAEHRAPGRAKVKRRLATAADRPASARRQPPPAVPPARSRPS